MSVREKTKVTSGAIRATQAIRNFVSGGGLASAMFIDGQGTNDESDQMIKLPAEIIERETGCGEMLDMLREADLQIEYMHNKFSETGSGNAVRARIKAVIAKYGDQQ